MWISGDQDATEYRVRERVVSTQRKEKKLLISHTTNEMEKNTTYIIETQRSHKITKNKFSQLHCEFRKKMNKFLESHNILNLSLEKAENFNRPIALKKIKNYENLLKNKSTEIVSFSKYSKTFDNYFPCSFKMWKNTEPFL